MPRKKPTPQDIEDALIRQDLEYIKDRVSKIDNQLEANYITRQEFAPIQKLVYGMVSLVLVTVFGALLAMVVIQG